MKLRSIGQELDPRDFKRVLRCRRCGHEQEGTPAAVRRDANGTVHTWCGSAFSYCNRCDGPVDVVGPPPTTQDGATG